MLTIHHLGHSQSERIVWLCEELGVPYELVLHERDPVTILSPPALRALHPLGAAPVIQDDGLLLAESAAITEYIIVKHGGGRLRLGPDHPDFASYLYWFHFANGNLQPVMGRLMVVGRAGWPPDHPEQMAAQGRLDRVMALVEARLGEADHLAGREFTAADIMTVNVITAKPGTTMDQAMEMMDAGYFRHLPVVDDGKMIGIISVRDAVRSHIQSQAQEVSSLIDYVHRGAKADGLR